MKEIIQMIEMQNEAMKGIIIFQSILFFIVAYLLLREARRTDKEKND